MQLSNRVRLARRTIGQQGRHNLLPDTDGQQVLDSSHRTRSRTRSHVTPSPIVSVSPTRRYGMGYSVPV